MKFPEVFISVRLGKLLGFPKKQRRPIWKRTFGSRVLGFVRVALRKVRISLAIVLFLVIAVYLWRELTRDIIIIDSFGVPKLYADQGLTGEVLATRVRARLLEIEKESQSPIPKDNFVLAADVPPIPELEVRGAHLSLKALIDLLRSILNKYPRRISADLDIGTSAPELTITLRLSQYRTCGGSVASKAADATTAVEAVAQGLLCQINPLALALHNVKPRDQSSIRAARATMNGVGDDLAFSRDYRGSAYNVLALFALLEGQSAEATTQLQKAVELDPKDASAYGDWGVVLLMEGNATAAVKKFEEASRIDSTDGSTYGNWALALLALDKPAEAAVKIKKAIALDSHSASLYNDWGLVLLKQQMRQEAIDKFRRSTELDGSYAVIYNNWGMALQELRKRQEAISKYERAIELDPELPVAYANWCGALTELDSRQAAIEKCQKALERSIQRIQTIH